MLVVVPGVLLAQPRKGTEGPTAEELELLQLLELLEDVDEADLELLLPAHAPARDGGT